MGDSFGILPAPPPAGFAAQIVCSGSIGALDPVAVVMVSDQSGNSAWSLRDYVDPSQPRTVCTLGDASAGLIDSRHLIVVTQDDAFRDVFAVVDLPEVRYHWFSIPPGGSGPQLIAVAPALDAIAWNAPQVDGFTDRIHLTTAAGDRVVATLPDTNPGRCGAPTDSNGGAYTRSGSALFVLDEPLPEISLIVVKGGKLALSMVGTATAATSTRPLKALWSPTSEALYFSQSGAIRRWTPASGVKVFLSGVTWDSAAISPDGAHLAYAVTEPDRHHDVYLVDLTRAPQPVRIGNGHRGGPVFLSDTQLFYLPDYEPGGCTGSGPPEPLIYDLATRTEAVSDVDEVGQVWPATGSNN